MEPLTPTIKGRSHLYPSAEALALIYGVDLEQSDKLDLTEERARLAKEQADAQELKNAVTRLEQAPVFMLTTALSRAAAQAAAILDSAKLNIKRKHPEFKGAVLDSIELEITKARNRIAEAELDFDDLDE